jgi:hypothetical protein
MGMFWLICSARPTPPAAPKGNHMHTDELMIYLAAALISVVAFQPAAAYLAALH